MIATLTASPAASANAAPKGRADAKGAPAFHEILADAGGKPVEGEAQAVKARTEDDKDKAEREDKDQGKDGTQADPAPNPLALALLLPAAPHPAVAGAPAGDAPQANARGSKDIAAAGDQPAQTAQAQPVQPGSRQAAQAASFDIEALFPGLAASALGAETGAVQPNAAAGKATAKDGSAAIVSGTASPVQAAGAQVVMPVAHAAKAEPDSKEAPASILAIDGAVPNPLAGQAHAHTASIDPTAPASAMSTASTDGVEQQLDVARDGEWLDRLARDIAGAADQDARLSFKLSPQHLGTLKVDLANGSDGTSVHMTTSSEAARNLLVDQQPRLIAEARAQGMRIADTQISFSGQASGTGTDGWSGQQQRQNAPTPPGIVTAGANTQPVAEIVASQAASGERYA